ncbi:MAG: helix-turn-helix transcriptional regulator [Ruminococcaceae bacterium]|nr:helix-turn-helix transcriptional regulator [Oscillospiraceae bacterium]
MKIKFYRSSKLFVKFFISYLILLCFSLTIFGVVYTKFEKDKIDYFYKYNISMLEQSKHIINNYISEVELLVENFESNSVIHSLCNGTRSLDDFKNNNYIDLTRILYEVKARTEIVDNVYLYITGKEMVLSSTGVLSAKQFYNTNDQYKKMEYSDFLANYLNDFHYKKFWGTGISGKLGRSYITYSQSLPRENYQNSEYKLFVQLNPEWFSNVLNPVAGANDALMMIVNKNGEIIYKNNKETKINTKSLVGHLFKSSDVIELTDTKEMITYTKSKEDNGWIYIVAVSKKEFLSEITQFKYLILLLSAGYLIFGVFLSQLLLKKNYRPIKLMIDKLSKNADAKNDYLDEMDFIHSVVDELAASNKDMKNVITKQSEQMKSDALWDIISNNVSSENINSMIKKFDFVFSHDNYAVVVVSAGDIENYSDDEKSVIYYAINNMADELVSTLYVYEKLIDTSGNMVFIVNVDDDNEDAFIEDTKFVCTLLSDVMTKEFSIGVDISISSLRKGIESLSNSYNEAIAALAANSGKITDYRDIQNNRSLKMIADIEEYIDAHYMNNNLSNTVIADEFNITGQYLSVLFKKYKKENLQNYIARVRVEYAKELLKNNKYTVFQIANMVGYSNDIGFIRVFKKLEGITPGKFRQMHSNK